MDFTILLVLISSLQVTRSMGYFQKPGRCLTRPANCLQPSADSHCIFHLDCPGSQLCCSVDGCLNACVDPSNSSMALAWFEDSDQAAASGTNGTLSADANSTAYAMHLNGPSTPLTFFTCRNGLRLSFRYRCNGKVDCPAKDNSDELDCPCTGDQSLCANGLCMDTTALCNPGSPNAAKCPLPNLNCTNVPCDGATNFRCRNGQCIPNSARCDSTFQCLDGSDEENCVCNAGNFNCDGGLCRSLLNVWCNGVADCQDMTDEPTNCSCVSGQFQCTNGRCIPQYQVCDLSDNCFDNSDEANCSTNCTTANNLYQCLDGSCISGNQACDGMTQCQDGSDELRCPIKGNVVLDPCARKGHFSCGTPSTDICVPLTSWCDQISDCPNQSDEPANCSTTCPTTSFQCDGLRCLSLESRCDGKVDCTDKTDELNCSCSDYQMPLPGSACLNQSLFCNGVRDAADDVDEESCTCKDRLALMNPQNLCDTIADCPNAEDEVFCGSCSTSQFYCIKSQQCVFLNQTCDGLADCSHGEDEETCLGMVPDCKISNSMSVQQERVGCLAVNNRGDWIPVCAERWSSSLSDAICEIMGYEKSILTNLLAMDPSEMPIQSADPRTPRDMDGPQIVISASKSCPSRKKVYIECGSLTCGQGVGSDFKLRQSRQLKEAEVPDGKYPWTTALYQGGKYFCSGTLIDERWVLTAAHCVVGRETAFIVARFGSNRRSSLNSNEQFISVDHIDMHPSFRAQHAVDIMSPTADLALLHLSAPVRWKSRVKAVCLSSHSNDLPNYVTLAGWEMARGRNVYLTGDSLREVSVSALSSSACQGNPLMEGALTNTTFCAGFSAVPSGHCVVDDGGAALEKNYFGRWNLVGVMSFVLGCNTPNAVAGFTSIAAYSDWIVNTTTKSMENNTVIIPTDCPGGVRCMLGQCISPSQICDGTVDCELASDELNCSTPLTGNGTSLNCTFQATSLCGYRQDLTDQLNWYRGGMINVNTSSFPLTATNTTDYSYIYISSSMANATAGSSGRLISPKIQPSSGLHCLIINYLVKNAALRVYDIADNNRVFFTHSEVMGEPLAGWSTRRLEVPSSVTGFVLDGQLSDDHSSLVALASVTLENGLCSSAIFVEYRDL